VGAKRLLAKEARLIRNEAGRMAGMIPEREIVLQKQRAENALETPDFQGFQPFFWRA